MKDNERTRRDWSAGDEHLLEAMRGARSHLQGYEPISLRQVFYRLVERGQVANQAAEYDALVRLAERAIVEQRLSWGEFEGRSPCVLPRAVYEDSSWFVDEQEAEVLTGYNRWLDFEQPITNEVWVLDPSFAHLCCLAADPLDVSVVVTDGTASISYLSGLAARAERAPRSAKRGLRLLLVGDLHPRSWAVLPNMLRTLHDDFGLGDRVQITRCAVTPEQAVALDLPRSPDPLDESDARTPLYREWLREHGHEQGLAVELAAVPPATLVDIVRRAIEEALDMDLLRRERAIEEEERAELAEYRRSWRTVVEAAAITQ